MNNESAQKPQDAPPHVDRHLGMFWGSVTPKDKGFVAKWAVIGILLIGATYALRVDVNDILRSIIDAKNKSEEIRVLIEQQNVGMEEQTQAVARIASTVEANARRIDAMAAYLQDVQDRHDEDLGEVRARLAGVEADTRVIHDTLCTSKYFKKRVACTQYKLRTLPDPPAGPDPIAQQKAQRLLESK